MRVRLALILCFTLALAASPLAPLARGDDADAVRREIEQLRRELEATQRRYQQAIDTMTERLQRLEARRGVAAAPSGAGPAGPGLPSLLEVARPREPFSLRGEFAARTPAAGGEVRRGQFLFDIGLAGDFVANATERRVEQAQTGTFAGRENRLFPREVELSLFGQVDPYARGEVRFEAAEEFEEGARELHLGLAEAHLTLLALPFGLQVKGGFMRPRVGLINELHLHDRPWIDSPAVTTLFFGEEGLRESGIELAWVPPTPVYLQAVVGVFNGDNEEAFGRGSLRSPLLTGRVRTFLELGRAGALQLGLSGATGESAAERRQSFLGVDAKYKYTPSGWSHALLTLGGEFLYSWRDRAGEQPAGDGDEVGGSPLGLVRQPLAQERLDTINPRGFYVWADVQPSRRWLLGVRYDWADLPDGRGDVWAVTPYLAFMPSEFLRFRLGYKHSKRDGLTPTSVDEILFQATFVLGAHPAHPF
jgi:hypothetical protein